MAAKDFTPVFQALRRVMLPYAERLNCIADEEGNLNVETNHIMKNEKPLWFGAVQTKKNYVSYHLMPVYVNPELLESISPELKKRMQGKSCFNFTAVDDALFKELAELTEKGSRTTSGRGSFDPSAGLWRTQQVAAPTSTRCRR